MFVREAVLDFPSNPQGEESRDPPYLTARNYCYIVSLLQFKEEKVVRYYSVPEWSSKYKDLALQSGIMQALLRIENEEHSVLPE